MSPASATTCCRSSPSLLEGDILEETLDRPDHGFIYAPLPNGDALKLPIGRVRRILQHLASLIDPKFPERTKLHALDAAALAGLEGMGLETPPDLAELAAKLKDFSGIEPVEPPAGVQRHAARLSARRFPLDAVPRPPRPARHPRR